ncbi:type II toxin-antitoxin system HipA family toxin [Galactobacter valiniphilus]|uniref:Type II toxin-antitoxin system HipA family toxin n=1 Tax=Galactobacter valiniphilus TaxID=2676122 RepID=A0A399JA69_9MICC|nr:HipA domain-containing protein [Galactobacter valiniphilus]RII40912.1 type II toxin-antitoxin system HipA family toxin [Galactobacter valiniphilus]
MSESDDLLDVWLNGHLAGTLMRGQSDDVEFAYSDEHLTLRTATPLSVSMPLVQQYYGPKEVMPWLSNLLPDAVEVRDRWAAKFHETRNDPFSLLRHMGQDAPGAVQVVPRGFEPSTLGGTAPITDARIAERIHEIIEDPDHWVDDTDEDEGRFSLGGNQGKFALALVDGVWHEPNGRTPSTHIIKPGMVTTHGHTNSEIQAVEFVTMRAAKRLGLTVAAVEIEDFAGLPAFVTKRYDRLTTSTGTLRMHQEDFCQALSLLPSRKYEEDGGPTMHDMVNVVRENSSRAVAATDLHALAQLFAFNLLTAGVDAHAKNHSLLLSGKAVRLAPAYDLISAHGIWDEKRVQFKSSAAVRYGKERRFRNISGRNLARAADTLGVPRAEFHEMLVQMQSQLPAAFEAAAAELPEGMRSQNVLVMPSRQERFGSDVAARATSQDLEETPSFTPPSNLADRGRPRVWVPGQVEGGRWVSGSYRSRGR